MKSFFPVLALFIALGSSVSFAQKKLSVPIADPFRLYLKAEQKKQFEPAFADFAVECGVDLNSALPRFADRPDNAWVLVKDISRGIHGLETDFFETVAVRTQGDRILVEMWTMQLDVASELRLFYCFDKQKMTSFQSADWTLPQEEDGKRNIGWGYEQRWKLNAAGMLSKDHSFFINGSGQVIRASKLNEETRRHLN